LSLPRLHLNRWSLIAAASGVSAMPPVTNGGVSEHAANELECARLRLASDDRVFRLHRRHLHEGRIHLVEDVTLPVALFPALVDEKGPAPSIMVLAARQGVLLGKAEERVSIGSASREVADALGIPVGAPVRILDRVVFARDGRAIEWRLAWCRLSGGCCCAGTA
jgi:DNA-binding GntR family transcriptional regulator